MNELIDKIELLKVEIENQPAVKKIRELNRIINSDEELNALIEEYKITRNEEIKSKIISNPLYLEYKKCENEVNFIILKIKSELSKVLKSKSGCVR